MRDFHTRVLLLGNGDTIDIRVVDGVGGIFTKGGYHTNSPRRTVALCSAYRTVRPKGPKAKKGWGEAPRLGIS